MLIICGSCADINLGSPRGTPPPFTSVWCEVFSFRDIDGIKCLILTKLNETENAHMTLKSVAKN